MTTPSARSTSDRRRDWQGPALFLLGFRPFFLMAGLWAVLAMVLWIAMLTGRVEVPTRFDPIAWHAHEFLFGYGSAVVAGFLLTAVPNWTGRLPVLGWPLAGLAGLWLLGRIAVGLGGLLPGAGAAVVVALADLALPVALFAVLLREILAGKVWRNLPVLGLLALFGLANGLFHLEAARGLVASDGYGLRTGLAGLVLLILLMGGRVTPSFTRNWLMARRIAHLPAQNGRLDSVALALSAVALAGFALHPQGWPTAALLALAGLANLARLSRWQGLRCGAEPLVLVLHAGYALAGLGFFTTSLAALDLMPQAAARHLWMAGAIALMSLAIMTRASLGHTGRPLHATPAITAIYVLVVLAVLLRLCAGIWPAESWLLDAAGGAWIAGYGTFSVVYLPIFTRAPVPKMPANRRP